MVFCIAGLVIFGILGIFSAKYRLYFHQALGCMKRKVLLRPCEMKFDQQMKVRISSGLASKSPTAGRFIYRHFELLSWLLLVLTVTSTLMVGYGVYSYIVFGNCNGPQSNDFCIFRSLDGSAQGSASLKLVNANGSPTIGNPHAPVKIIEVGCFSCPYTKSTESIRLQLFEKYSGNLSFTFMAMPLPAHQFSWQEAEAAKCAQDQNKYWEYHDKLFEYQDSISSQKLLDIATELGLDSQSFTACVNSHKYKNAVQRDYDAGVAAGIYATPTYYVNGQPVVGLKAFADLENLVITEIKGSCPTA